MTEEQITETEEVEPVVDEELPTENGEKSDDDLDTTEGTDSDLMDDHEKDDEQDTFPREYVEKLRDESARYRQRAQKVDELEERNVNLAERLHHALVTATGRLMDPSDLEFDESHLEDPKELSAAIDDLLEHKPYLAKRTLKGDIGQGASEGSTTVDLAGMLRARA